MSGENETGIFSTQDNGGSPISESSKGVTGTTLKIIAIVAMLIDHTAAIVLENYLDMTMPANLDSIDMQAWFTAHPGVAACYDIMLIMRLIGRFGFPLFAFLIVEGFVHTHSVKNYAVKLGMFAVISELIFNLGFNSTLFCPHYQNVFFTLALGVLCLAGIKYLRETKKDASWQKYLYYLAALLSGPYTVYMLLMNAWPVMLIFQATPQEVKWIMVAASGVISLVLFALLGIKWDREKKISFTAVILSLSVFSMLAELLLTDYSGGGVLTICVMYLWRERKKFAFSMGCLVLTLMTPVEATAFLMLIPISKYNGKRGMKKFNKYFFYVFYPVHIGLLYLLTLLLGFTTFSLGF